jgi:ATP adenylyltransferase
VDDEQGPGSQEQGPEQQGPEEQGSEEQGPEEHEARLRVFPELAREFAAAEDGFERLWTPHRMAYIKGERPSEQAGEGCPFCLAPQRADDAEGLIVHRGEHCYVVMNLFPYNPGHVLVCPYRHVALYLDLNEAETAEFTALTRASIQAHGLQHRHEPGLGRGGRRAGAPAPARCAALGRGLELPARHRPDQGAADAARGRPPAARRRVAALTRRPPSIR